MALFGAGLLSAHATVTPYSWIRMGEAGNVFTDSSGNGKNFTAAFSTLPAPGGTVGGNPMTVLVPTGVGGPLGTTDSSSAISTLWGSFNTRTSGMWIQGPNNGPPTPDLWSFPATNWVMECWVLPLQNGTTVSSGGQTAIFVGNGSNNNGATAGGQRFRIAPALDEFGEATGEPQIYLEDMVVTQDNPASTPENELPRIPKIIGTPVPLDTTKWTHVAAVNDNGSITFYVNGVASGPAATGLSAPSGSPTVGSGPDTVRPFHGYLDELRFSTFEPGQFQISDLLLRPPGPSVITQPASATVWEGGAAPFAIDIAYDESATYQWRLGGTTLAGEAEAELRLPAVTAAQSGGVYSVDVTTDGVTVTSESATLTVQAPATEHTNFYRAAVEGEASLLAYFPVDGDTGATVTNVKNSALNAQLVENAFYDGRTDRSFGQRALQFQRNGLVTFPNHTDLEFTDGTGTIEAIIYLAPTISAGQATIFALADEGQIYCQFQASLDGGSLSFSSDNGLPPVSWSVPTSLRGRFAHVAFVFSPGSSASGQVTAYVDGVSLGAKDEAFFGNSNLLPAYIGSAGPKVDIDGETIIPLDPWLGTIDELAIYNDALPASTIAVHNSRFLYGTAVAPPEITSQPTGPLNLLAGGAPVLRVTATGSAPLAYQWKHNGVDITGDISATTPTLVLNNSTVAQSGDYTVTVSNPQGSVASTPVSVTFTAPADSYAQYVLGDNPSAYWRLNEAGGSVLKDYAGGLDGTYASTVGLGVAGAPGLAPDTAAHFPGEGNPVPNAVVPFSPTLNPQGPFSLEFWVKPNFSGQTGRAVIGNQNRNPARAGVAVYQGLNGAFWEAHLGYAETVLFIQGTTVPEAGRWDHVVVTWDGTNTARIFVNGQDDTHPDSTVAGPHRPNAEVPFEIGSRSGNTIPYQGVIDEVAFYNHQLTPEQIAGHFAIDASPPEITSVVADASLRRVRVTFNRAMNPDTATVLANYTLTGGPTLTGVAPTNDPSVINLVTSGLTPGGGYTLSVSGVTDTRFNETAIVPVSLPFRAGTLKSGGLAFDLYTGIGGTAVSALYEDDQYPDGVFTSSTVTSFSTGVDFADNYGAHVYGWITPTVTGDYRFFLRSDDASELWLSADENPAGADLIAMETGCCNAFLEPGSPQTSEPFHLVAGQRYYIAAFGKEGGGGDFLQVAWREENNTTAAASLSPIPGEFLSTYVVSELNFLPLNTPVFAGGQVSLTWDQPGTLEESTDLKIWTPVTGAPTSPYVTPATGSKFYRLVE